MLLYISSIFPPSVQRLRICTKWVIFLTSATVKKNKNKTHFNDMMSLNPLDVHVPYPQEVEPMHILCHNLQAFGM